jgi:hypothetical protein
MKLRLLSALLAFSIFGIFSILVALAWLAYEPPPIEDLVRTLQTPEVAPGVKLIIHSRYRSVKRCQSILYRDMYDGYRDDENMTGKRVRSESELRPRAVGQVSNPGEWFDIVRSIDVPNIATPGQGTFNTVIVWECNFMQRLFPYTETLNPIRFTIIAKDLQKQSSLLPLCDEEPVDFCATEMVEAP